MMSTFVENLLMDLCLDSRIPDGMFVVDKKDHIEILREYLYDRRFGAEFVSEYINNLVEGKYPERQAYTETGYLSTFDTVQGKKEAIASGSHFDKNPVRSSASKLGDKEKSKIKKKEPLHKKSVKDDKKEDKKEETPEKKTSEKKYDKKEKKKDEEETGSGESNLDFIKKKEDTPEEDKPRKEEWKETPDDTRRRAESLGWEKDTNGNWYCDTDFVGITAADGFVVPIKDGDKNSPTEWPTHICVKKDEEK